MTFHFWTESGGKELQDPQVAHKMSITILVWKTMSMGNSSQEIRVVNEVLWRRNERSYEMVHMKALQLPVVEKVQEELVAEMKGFDE